MSGKPISFPTASKVFTEVDYHAPYPNGLRFVRDYRSDGFSYPVGQSGSPWLGLGHSWTHNYAGALYATPDSLWVQWGADVPAYFSHPDPQSPFPRRLASIKPGEPVQLIQFGESRFGYYTAANELVVFEGGKPVLIQAHTGWAITLSSGPYGVASASDPSGRSLVFSYDAKGHLAAVTDPSGTSVRYEYKEPPVNPGPIPYEGLEFTTLKRVVFQDGKSWQYIVPTWQIGGTSDNSLATRITGTIDELGTAFQTISYTSGGTVQSTWLAGGVEKYTVSNSSVTDPLGASRSYTYGTLQSNPNELVRVNQPAGAGCSASSTEFEYDWSTRMPKSRIDFKGAKTCYAYDTSGRNLESVRVEGLDRYASCTSVTDGATVPTGARKISAAWHPDWRLQTKMAEPGRITTYVYNGQPDPFAGGALASCAPADALLPDGKPIAVLCRQVGQATTDANGSQGFNATLQSGVAAREERWTYNRRGQVLTHDGPRTDVNDITTSAYYSDTSFTGSGVEAVGHTLGDVQSVTNPAGQVTQYTKYNKHGQLLESIGPNGVVSTRTYDLRQRLLSVTEAGQTTTYTYDAAGQLTRITWLDASYIGYEYDPAHRQTAVFDHLGNRIEYTLDNAGNRIAENVKDPGGVLSRQLSRSIDALGRVQQTTGRE